MSRGVWSLLLLVVFALPLASCFSDDKPCPTCPQENSAILSVFVRPLVLGQGQQDTLKLDSAFVSLDGTGLRKALPGQTVQYDRLGQGRHQLQVQRYFNHYGAVETRSTTLFVDLDEGERRTLEIHGDFPRIGWLPSGLLDRALARWAGRRGSDRVG